MARSTDPRVLNAAHRANAAASSARKPKIKLPAGYEDESEFLMEMRHSYAEDLQADLRNRDAALEDLQFVIGNQWDDATRQRRDAARKPILTINRLPAFVNQVIGSRRLNETQIRVIPDNGGTVQTARVREGLIRSIQKISRAKRAYDNALAGAVMCGIGNFQVALRDCEDDVWARDIAIETLPDHLSVIWDRMLTEPSGSDARHCFVVDTMPKHDFRALYPWAQPSDVMVDTALRGDLRVGGWYGVDDVRVVNYWRIRSRKRTYALLTNGATVDITDLDGESDSGMETLSMIAQKDDGSPIVREVDVRFAQMFVCSGLDVLEGPHELPINRVPVFRVPGQEVRVGSATFRCGLVRDLKDPQRLHNYWRSVVAEKLMQAPRGVWVAPDSAVQGREAAWRNSHLTDDPLLIYNAESGSAPQRIQPAQVEDALLAQAEITNQDIKDVSNIHEANLGMPSNEVSGRAIDARKRISDTGTIIYHDNLTSAIEECGRVINQLIPIVYDTKRVVKVLGEDGKEAAQAINTFDDPNAIDITLGKYSVTATTGTSYDTKRVEAAEAMMALAQAMPQTFSIAPDLMVEAQDWPEAQRIAARLRNNLPPGVLGQDEQTPETAQRAMGAQQAQAQQAQVVLAQAQSKLRSQESQTVLNYARARNFMSQSELAPQKQQESEVNTASQVADRTLRGHLEAVRVATGS